MVKRIAREEIRRRFETRIENKEAIVVGTAGSGLIAKMQEQGGVDLIMILNSVMFRMDGAYGRHGTVPYGDCNGMVLNFAPTVLPQVQDTPVIGGVGAADPYRNLDKLLDKMLKMGFSGFTNVPSGCGGSEGMRNLLDGAGIGLDQDVKLIKRCREKDAFSIVIAFTEDQIRALVQAGTDVVTAMAGGSVRSTLYKTTTKSLDDACESTQRICEIVKQENPETYVFIYGGPFWNYENVQYCLDHTDAKGFVGQSCLERIPVEKAIVKTFSGLKELSLR